MCKQTKHKFNMNSEQFVKRFIHRSGQNCISWLHLLQGYPSMHFIYFHCELVPDPLNLKKTKNKSKQYKVLVVEKLIPI